MEHKLRMIDEPSSSSSAYCSTREELDAASSSVYTCVVGNAEKPTSSRYWTSIEYASDSDDEGYVRVLPGRDVPKFDREQLKLLEKIGEGGQGTIYTAQLTGYETHVSSNEETVVAKLYKGRCGLWPEDVFGLHQLNPYLCKFHGYCLEGESLYLIMAEYDGSLRDVLDNLMKGKVEGRPFEDITSVLLIIGIALGMCFLHENNIIHRDLKADNVFVTVNFDGELSVHIGDFDVASRVVGTLFWRAPEVLQALKEGERPFFTPKADVYSFAMTCYEILTGGVPLEGVRASDYDAVLQHRMRPKLPSNLNPKVKNLMRRCWHQDPEARPTFKEIVVELKELHRELITGSEDVSKAIDYIFTIGSSSIDIVGASPEACLWELKALIESLLVKYGKEDFVLICMEMVGDLEQYQSEFGFRSFEEHPQLLLAEWFAREKLYDRFQWNEKVSRRIRANIFEMLRIEHLLTSITLAIDKNYSSSRVLSESINILSSYDKKAWVEEWKAWKEERSARVLPEHKHVVCMQGGAGGQAMCDLCKMSYKTPFEPDVSIVKSNLYVNSSLASIVSSLTEKIGSLRIHESRSM